MTDLISYINYLTEFAYRTKEEDIRKGVRPLTFLEMFEYNDLEANKLYESIMLLIEKMQ